MATTENTALLHSAFYRFVPIADPPATAGAVRALASAQGLRGSIVVAREGISGAVAGAPASVAAFEAALEAALEATIEAALPGPRVPVPGTALRRLAFRHSACTSAPFGRLKVSVKPEIVALGLPQGAGGAPLPSPDDRDASHLAPPAWRDLLTRDDVVVLDNRNHFEVRLGRFRGAVDPQVHNFRDFVAYVEQHAPDWRAARRPVAMYCTGGIRCDKTAPWMRGLGLDVYQLEGGILNYLEQMKLGAVSAGSDWVGECFVFDNRIALDSGLHETATTAVQVFDAQHPDEAWRLQRAHRLGETNEAKEADGADEAPQ